MEYLYYEQEIGSNRSMLRGHLLVSMIGLEERRGGLFLLAHDRTHIYCEYQPDGRSDRPGWEVYNYLLYSS